MTDENNLPSEALTKEGNQPVPKNELEKIKQQAEEYLNGWKRVKADYINLKKETDEQMKEIRGWMAKIYLIPFLDILDNFDKAFAGLPENLKTDEWAKGVERIKKQLEDYLKTQGVIAMAAKREKFDPIKHEAVESVDPPAGGGQSGMIAEEIQKGYLINDEVLRPAKVKVYK